MSFTSAYNKSASRDIEFTPQEEATEILLKTEELKKWLNLPFTRELLLFLGKRELELLNNARNCSNVSSKNDNTDKNLHKSSAIREVIEFMTENKKPKE